MPKKAKGSNEELLQLCNRRLTALERSRLSWFYHMRELATYIQPRLGRFFETPNESDRGARKNYRIINSVATTAAMRFGAGMFAGTTNPARPWFRIGITGMEIADNGRIRLWLDALQKKMLQILAASNFYRSIATIFEEMGVMGTGVMLMYEHFENVVRYFPKAAGEYYLAVDGDLNVTTFAEKIVMTVGEMVDRFGRDHVSESASTLYGQGTLDEEFIIGHIVMPNADYIPGGFGVDGMKYVDISWEWGGNSNKLLERRGHSEQPFIAPRWHVTGNDAYGRSPGMDGLGDVKSLQLMEKRKAQFVDKLGNPPMVADATLKNKPATTIPGGVTFIAGMKEGSAVFKPAYEVHPQGLPAMSAEIERVENRIKTVFYEDLFLMIANIDRANVTAAEIYERKEEKMLMLGPPLERIHDEGLSLVIKYLFSRMAKANILPGDIPEEIRGRAINIEFISILAQAQKAAATATVERLWALAGNISAVKPEVLDNLDADATIREYADMLGSPQKLLVDPKVVLSLRAERAKREQAMVAGQAGMGAAQSAKVLSETQVGGGQNALQKVLGLAA
jgi:hypothetical protein